MLKGQNVIISGASRGIGRAIALELASNGANISFNYVKSEKEAQDLEKEIASLGVKVKAFQVDIRDYSKVKAWVEATKELFGTLDVVINNAGIIKDKALALMELNEWQEVIETNLGGTFNLTRASIVTLVKQKKGNIINITSITGLTGFARQTNYAAAKAGIIGFTRALAKELAGYNIRVNAIAPGFIETDMLKNLKEEYKQALLKRIPLSRFGRPQEVAKLVRFLLTDSSDYINGQTLIIDGGLSLG